MNTNKNFDLNDLRSFIAVIDCGSFTQAANQLNLSRSHLSKQVKKLEQDIGLLLINRTTRALSLTEQGQLLYSQVRHSLSKISNVIDEINENNHKISGVININSVGGIIGENILTPIFADFCRTHPEIEINLDFTSTKADLIKKDYDLIIRMGKLDDSSFMAKKIFDCEICTLATPKYLKQQEQIKHPKDLKKLNCLTGSVTNWSFREKKSGRTSNVKVSGNLNCKNGRSLLNAAKMHLGVVRLPKIYCENEIKKGQLVEVIKGWSIETVPVHVLYYSRDFQHKKISSLLQFIDLKMISKR